MKEEYSKGLLLELTKVVLGIHEKGYFFGDFKSANLMAKYDNKNTFKIKDETFFLINKIVIIDLGGLVNTRRDKSISTVAMLNSPFETLLYLYTDFRAYPVP